MAFVLGSGRMLPCLHEKGTSRACRWLPGKCGLSGGRRVAVRTKILMSDSGSHERRNFGQDRERRVFLEDINFTPFQDLEVNPDRFTKVGAYAIFDESQTLRYVGYSRNLAAKLRYHAALQRRACHSFKLYIPERSEIVAPEDLESVLDMWIVQNGSIPLGNAADRSLWEAPSRRRTKGSSGAMPRTDSPIAKSTRVSRDTPSPPPSSAAANSQDAFPRARPYTRGYDPGAQYDPFDPFSATNSSSSRSSVGNQMLDNIAFNDTWYPIVLVSGVAFVLWILNLSLATSRPLV